MPSGMRFMFNFALIYLVNGFLIDLDLGLFA